MSFAENLKQLRKDKQLSQEELAEILDVSRQAVSKWEQGIGYPEVEKLLLLSSKLSVSLDSLMETELAQNSNTKKQNVEIENTNDGGENKGLFNDLKLFKPTKTKILLTTIQIISGTKTFKNFLIKITIISI